MEEDPSFVLASTHAKETDSGESEHADESRESGHGMEEERDSEYDESSPSQGYTP